nr:bifunctional 3'-5' exonuclease/DNA polymerase [Phaeacidiphilus oryzae]
MGVVAGARMALVADLDGAGGVLQWLADDGRALGAPRRVPDLAVAVAEVEREGHPRWVWADTDELYPRLLPQLTGRRARLGRCHDVALTERLLLGSEGALGRPRSLGAAWARLHGHPEPPDAEPHHAAHEDQDALFSVVADRSNLPPGVDPLAALVEVHADQLRRLRAAGRELTLLAAAESAGALAAAELGFDGLPWRTELHDRLLVELLGPRPRASAASGGALPPALAALGQEIQRALRSPRLNPDSPAQLLRAFAEQGISLPSLRMHQLRALDHPAAPLVVRYRELARIHTAHGWAWQDRWVRDGRFRPEYVVGGVVSGRWASRGGGALQIPRVLRGAVVADPGHRLVVADAGQLEPRILAAMSRDPGLARAAARGDLYAGLAAEAFGGDRARAKIALLAAMYGQTGGEGGQLVNVLRHRFPRAMELVEAAARTGESGGSVRSLLGRVSPVLGDGEGAREFGEDGDPVPVSGSARAWGRFTRNFVIQATAAEWALVLLVSLRRRLAELGGAAGGDPPRLVFFQHDEVVVHAAEPLVPGVLAAIAASAEEAGALLFGPSCPVPFPMDAVPVDSYADAKEAESAGPVEEAEEGAV